MAEITNTVRVLEGLAPDQIPFDELMQGDEPVILRGLVSNWELVEAGKTSPEKAMALLQRHASGRPVGVYIAPAHSNARFSYNDDCSGFNYEHKSLELAAIFAQIRAAQHDPEHAYYYMNSLTLDESFPGLREQNDLQFNHPHFANNKPLAKLWLGTESMASAHYDVPSNLACCVLGPRRFTLFPPEQIHNLYPGPMELTPGGQVVAMVDFRNPDFERFPRARQAVDAAVVVDLEPGDAVFYPSMWWHQVEALAPFNIMINYWWRTAPAYMGNPLDIVMHAILGLRDRPESEKKAWREVMDYYVFGSSEKPREHLPEGAHGPLADVDDTSARRLRALVKNSLNR